MTYNIHGGVVTIPGDSDIERLVMHGGIINLYGPVGRLIHHGGIINRFGEANSRQTEPRVIYKDRVVYKDRVIYRDKIVIRDREDCQRELRELRSAGKYWQQKADMLEQENQELKKELDDTERVKLLRTIENLQDKLKASHNREQQLKCRAREAERKAEQTQAAVWNEFRPSKEACRQLYENLKAFMDCETDSNFLNLK